MIIITDSREQARLDFSGIDGVEKVEEMGLSYGDYNAIVHGKVVPIFFERKGLGDLFGTMTSGYERFKKEMARAKAANVKLILVIEGSYTDIWNGFERSQYSGPAMLKKLAMLFVKYDLEYIFCENRRVMARRIVDVYAAVERHWTKNSKTISNLGVNSVTPIKDSPASLGEDMMPEMDD